MEICICACYLTGEIVFAFTNSSGDLIVHSYKLINKNIDLHRNGNNAQKLPFIF